jgi:hypothetical protein
MAQQEPNIQITKTETSVKTEVAATDLTRMLFESQSTGLAELYQQMNKSISITKIIEYSKSFEKTSVKTLRQICR